MVSENQDSIMGLDMKQTQRELPYNDLVRTIDMDDIYLDELDESDSYRLSFTINPLLTNILTSVTGSDSLETFNQPEFISKHSPMNGGLNVKTNITYKESIDMHLRIDDGWVGYNKPNGLSIDCHITELAPKKSEMCFINGGKNNNWSFGLYYISSKSQPHSHSGLIISDYEVVDYSGRILYRIFTPFKHNLSRNDKVYLNNIGSASGEYMVLDLGDDDSESKENMFVVDLPTPPVMGIDSYMMRIVNGVKSSYYQRTLTKLTNVSNYTLMQMGFANNIFNDNICQLVYDNPINVSNLFDYRGRPIMELVIGVFKNTSTPSDNTSTKFTSVQSGYDLNYNKFTSKYIADARRLDGSIDTLNKIPLEKDISAKNKLIYDFVEFNTYEMKEYVLAETLHRFNLQNRVKKPESSIVIDGGTTLKMGIRLEGYMYKPFYSVKLREESTYIEYGESNDIIPRYAIQYAPLKYVWRDVLPKHMDEVIYPFVNGNHYINKNIDFFLKRQDPFNQYGLNYNKFPMDAYGSRNNFKKDFIKLPTNNNEC